MLVGDEANGAVATYAMGLAATAKDEKLAYSTINAHAKAASTKPAFRAALETTLWTDPFGF